MDKTLKETMPIYIQIMEKIRFAIVSGELTPGSRIDSVRELASFFNVNPNTMQRALSALEKEGLLCSERTAGRFITDNRSLIENIRYEAAQKLTADYGRNMRELGYGAEEIRAFLPGDWQVRAV